MNEEQIPEAKPVKSGGRARGLIIVALVIIGGYWLFSALRNSAERQIIETLNSTGCSLSTYRSQARPIMDDFNALIEDTDLSTVASRNSTYLELNPLMARVNNIECRSDYPLKQETLLFSIQHYKDAIDALNRGDADEANQSLDLAIINAERFNDWSVDVD